MRDVASDGRTVLLVSHNMAAVANLCSRAVVLRSGRLAFDGDVAHAIAEYSARASAVLVGDLRDRHDRAGKGEIRSTSIALRGDDGCSRAESAIRAVRHPGRIRGEGAPE